MSQAQGNGPFPPPPLSTPELVGEEMAVAGVDVRVERFTRTVHGATSAQFVEAARTSFAPVCLLAE